jgi:hypothetical protein
MKEYICYLLFLEEFPLEEVVEVVFEELLPEVLLTEPVLRTESVPRP